MRRKGRKRRAQAYQTSNNGRLEVCADLILQALKQTKELGDPDWAFFDQLKAGAKAFLDANSQGLHADARKRGVARAPKHQFVNLGEVKSDFAYLVPLLSKGASLT